ncbi:hypothetical protein ACFZB5_34050 [Streptomyces nodosus]
MSHSVVPVQIRDDPEEACVDLALRLLPGRMRRSGWGQRMALKKLIRTVE